MKQNKKQQHKKGRGAGNGKRFLPRTSKSRENPRARGALRPTAPVREAEGVFAGTKNGYGFVELDGQTGGDIFIPAAKTLGAIDGDRVAIRYRAYTRDGVTHTEGEVTRIVEVGRTTVIGTLCEDVFLGRGHRRMPRYTVVPDDTHLNMEVFVKDPEGAKPGDKVEVLLSARRPGAVELTGTILCNFGPAASREANYAAILADCGITVDFTQEELEEAEQAAKEPLSAEGRTDLRDRIIFTIDGADAKDLDDAISLTRLKNGAYELGVHIADVSNYVAPKTRLDAASLARGTSVYFTDKVVPMLPPALSNGACSLNAHEDKYALSAIMEIAPDGTLGKTRIERTLIRSCVRGVYSEVNDLFEKGKGSPFYEKYKAAYPTLTEMRGLYLILAAKARKRGALELEQTEAKILLDEDGMPSDIVPRVRGDAEKMIEQFMLAANESVATLLNSRELPCVYRVHEAPNKEKLAEFAIYVHNLGFDASFITRSDPTGCDFSHLLEEAGERGLGGALSYTLLRTMAKAHYSEICHPHFGLGIEKYCHFTSPIRRLSDLATHRMIKAVLLDGEPKARYAGYARRAAAAASETELKALSAERRIDALYKALYLSKRLGEVYPATVSSVTRFGVFAALDNTCEGLIPMTELPGGIWIFDEGNLSLRSPRGQILTLGNRIEICVEEVDIARGKVRFSLVSADSEEPENPPAARLTTAEKADGARKPRPAVQKQTSHAQHTAAEKKHPGGKKQTNNRKHTASGKKAAGKGKRRK